MNQWQAPNILGYYQTGPVAPLSVFAQLSIPLQSVKPEGQWVLHQAGDQLSLMRPDGVELFVDMTSGKARHRAGEAGHGAKHLAKALGLAGYRRRWGAMPDITDATAGLGQDAWVMASLGCRVTLIEQHPIVHALLENALYRALANADTVDIAQRIRLLHANAAEQLGESDHGVIFLDPMYPHRARKKANSKKGMQFLHALLGPVDTDASSALLTRALECRPARVVVKRPKGAELLEGSGNFSGQLTTIESPNTRYDIYHRSEPKVAPQD